jgi:hypothetical protein
MYTPGAPRAPLSALFLAVRALEMAAFNDGQGQRLFRQAIGGDGLLGFKSSLPLVESCHTQRNPSQVRVRWR